MKKVIIGALAFGVMYSCSGESNQNLPKENQEVTIDNMPENDLVQEILSLEKVLIDSNTNLAKKEESIKLLEAVKKLSERFPKVKNGENLKYKGVLASRGLNKPYEAVMILDQLVREYPNSERKVDYLFEKAVLLQDNLNGKEEARKIYTQLANDYPDHHLGKDSKNLLNMIDMTDEELIEFLNSKNAK